MPSATDAFETLRFSTDDLPEQIRIEAFRDVYARTIFNHDVEALGDQPIRFYLALCTMPELGVAAGEASPLRAARGLQHITGDDLVLNVTLTGGRVVQQLGREVTVAEGGAVLATGAEPGCLTIHQPSRFVSIRVPRLAIAPLITDLDRVLVQSLPDNGSMRLLVDYVRIVQDANALATAEMRRVVSNHVHDLVAAALGATRDATEVAQGRGVRAAKLRAIKRDICEHLDRPDLSVNAVAMRHQVSPRYVQMLFEADGTTFSAFVLCQRLARAHRLLVDARHADRTISMIAFAAGFGDLSYFNRTFRRLYSASPSEVRATALRAVDS